MKTMYVNTETGELTDVWEDGLQPVEAPSEVQEDSEWLVDYYLRKRVKVDAQLSALKIMYDRRVRALEGELRGLEVVYGNRVKLVVNGDLVGAKKKSVDYEYGTMGYRTSNRTEVTDKKAAIAWARENAPDAVKVELKETLLKSELPKKAQIPGIERIKKNNFYVSIPKS